MRRKGLGKGMGQGYKNLVSIYDSHVHSLSAKGVKTLLSYKYKGEETHNWSKIPPKKLSKLESAGLVKPVDRDFNKLDLRATGKTLMSVKGWKPIKGSLHYWISDKGAVVGINLTPQGWQVVGRTSVEAYNSVLKTFEGISGTVFKQAKEYAIQWAKNNTFPKEWRKNKMSLKDWKKAGVNRWRKKGMIVDVSISKSDHHYLTKPAWVMFVKHERSNQYFKDEVFPSKQQALKFTKDYMRKH